MGAVFAVSRANRDLEKNRKPPGNKLPTPIVRMVDKLSDPDSILG